MRETGLGWFMGWDHIWYVGTGWRKRLVITLLGGHAWLWSSALSRAAAPLLGTLCRTSWPGTCVPWAYRAVKARDTDLRGEGTMGRAVVSLHAAWSSSSMLGQYTPPEGLVSLVQNRGRCAVEPGWHERAYPSPRSASGVSQPAYPPPAPGNLCLAISPLGAYALLLSFGRNVSASLTTGLNFTRIKSLWKPKLACWWATQKRFLSTALPSLGFALSETQSGHGGISDLAVDGSERNIILLEHRNSSIDLSQVWLKESPSALASRAKT